LLDFIVYPLGKLMKIIYDFTGNYGVAIVLFTIVIRMALLPFSIKQTQSSKKMNVLSPKMKEIQEKYKNDKEQLNVKLMELYKENNYNPAAGCLPTLLQMPILFSLFYVLQDPIKYVFSTKEAFALVHKSFLWISNVGLTEQAATIFSIPGIGGLPILAILAGLTTWYQMRMIMPSGSNVDPTQKSMTMIMPFMFAFFTLNVPSGLAVYWVIGNFITIITQYFLLGKKPAVAVKEVKK